MARFLNFVLYEIGWFAIVCGAGYSQAAAGTGIAMALVAIHLWLTNIRSGQAILALVAGVVGLVVDCSLLQFGVFEFPEKRSLLWLPPLWMSVLWVQFSTTFRYCLRWLSGRYVLSASFAFVGAPLAFLAGEKIGAITFCEPRSISLLTLGALWAIAIPLLIYLSDRIHKDVDGEASYHGLAGP